jgi:F-type H+/Na+-transporting ATPase subunit alpha
MAVEEQVVAIYAGTSGALDDVPVTEVRRFESELLEWMRSRHGGLLSEIRDTGTLPEGGAVENAVESFKTDFLAGLATEAGGTADPTSTDAEAVGEAESDKTLETE